MVSTLLLEILKFIIILSKICQYKSVIEVEKTRQIQRKFMNCCLVTDAHQQLAALKRFPQIFIYELTCSFTVLSIHVRACQTVIIIKLIQDFKDGQISWAPSPPQPKWKLVFLHCRSVDHSFMMQIVIDHRSIHKRGYCSLRSVRQTCTQYCVVRQHF